MQAHVLTIENPFDPLASRRNVTVRRPHRIRRMAPRTDAPVIAILNEKPVLRVAWGRRLRHGDRLRFMVLPRGGGGTGGSNPLPTLLMIGLAAFSGPLAAAILGRQAAASVLFGTFTLGSATQLGIVLAGSSLISALVPVQSAASLPAASPTYSLAAQGNAARIEQAIPVQYGRLLSYPDFAAQPYFDFHDDDQYVYQLLCLGCGEFDIEEIRIEDTPISSFSEIESEIVGPGEDVTLFPTAVITSVEVAGQEMMGMVTGTWSRTTTVLTVTEVAHGRGVGQALHLILTTGTGPVDGVYAIATVTGVDTYTVTVATGSGSGDVEIRPVVGGVDGFVASAAETVAYRLSIDVVLPRGLYSDTGGGSLDSYTVGWTVQVRQVDDNALPIGSWAALGTPSLTDRTTTPLRRSFNYSLPTPGRYRVRLFRTQAKSDSTDIGNEILWSGMRAYLREPQDFGDVTLIALRMRATNNLSVQASRRIGVISTRKLPIWNGSTWSAATATRSIAWAIADAARDAAYGAGLADAKVDLAALLALDAEWAARGDTFNARFDQAGSWWEAVTMIAAAGRARPFMQGGVLRVVRDSAATVPVALYSMRNIRRGTFAVDYLMANEDTADRVEVSYFDQTTWQQRRVTAALAGSAATKPAKVEIFGITDPDQALREGLYLAAANKYRRRIARFATEMDGFIPSIGDLIAIQHDMPGWGQHGEAVAWNAGSLTLTLSNDVTFGEGTHYVGLRGDDGALTGPWEVTAGALATQLVFAEAPDLTPYTGSEKDRTHITFGGSTSWRALAKVLSATPASLHDITIEAVLEDPSVHTADTGVTAPPITYSPLPRKVTKPVIRQLLGRKMPGDNTRALLSWEPAPDADIYQIEMAEGTDVDDPDVSWTRIGDTTASTYTARLLHSKRTMIRIRGVGLAAGPWKASTMGDLIPGMWNSSATLMWSATDTDLMWSA